MNKKSAIIISICGVLFSVLALICLWMANHEFNWQVGIILLANIVILLCNLFIRKQ